MNTFWNTAAAAPTSGADSPKEDTDRRIILEHQPVHIILKLFQKRRDQMDAFISDDDDFGVKHVYHRDKRV